MEDKILNDSGRPNDYFINDIDCLSDDDLYQNLWITSGVQLENIMDYFWESEILWLCQDENGSFYIDYSFDFEIKDRFGFKYQCYKDDNRFKYCNNEDCSLCRFYGNLKIPNSDYLLYQKHSQAYK